MSSLKIKAANYLRARPRLRMYYDMARFFKAAHTGPSYECSLCGYEGHFYPFGASPRLSAACARCGSVERQRLVVLWFKRNLPSLAGQTVLHFAPEPSLKGFLQSLSPEAYKTADINPGRADYALNIEKIDLPDASFDVVVCNHVLEHVDPAKALSEIHRILKPGGRAVLTVPLVDAWGDSYENPSVTTDEGREVHFGQRDHIRIFGRDFDHKIEAAGFALEVMTANGADSAKYRLMPGESVFVGAKA